MKKDIKNFILENFLLGKADDISDDASLILSGLVDSFAVLDIMQFITDRFGVKIPEDKVTRADFDSVNVIAATVERFKK